MIYTCISGYAIMQLPGLILRAYRYTQRTILDFVVHQGETIQLRTGRAHHTNSETHRDTATVVSEESVVKSTRHVDPDVSEIYFVVGNTKIKGRNKRRRRN